MKDILSDKNTREFLEIYDCLPNFSYKTMEECGIGLLEKYWVTPSGTRECAVIGFRITDEKKYLYFKLKFVK